MTPGKTAHFLKTAIENSGLTQREIARRAGFPKPNFISMMKTGETKVPIDRIPALAEALDIPAIDFLRIAMREYQPEVWTVLTKALGAPLTKNEELLLFTLDVADPDERIVFDDSSMRLIAAIFDHLELEARLREDMGDADEPEDEAV
mgnify:FL=1